MPFPRYPGGRRIVLEDKPLFDRLFASRPPVLSAYTFTNLFAWGEPYQITVSSLDDFVVVSHSDGEHTALLEPIGAPDPPAAVRRCLEVSGGQVVIDRVCEQTAAALADDPGIKVEFDRDNSDYVYLSSDLIELPGRKFDAKRNFIHRFPPDSYEYVPMTGETARECLSFVHEWCKDRSCDTVEGLRRERCAVFQMLTHFSDLGIRGGAVRMNGRVTAFSLGEPLNPDTLVVHVEKADPNIPGLYQLINKLFCAAEAREYRFVNREQDLGVPGLRKAKESYHPVRLEKAFRVSARTG